VSRFLPINIEGKIEQLTAGTPVSSTNKTDYHEITEILLKVA
jgi:hypothetical protein